MSVPVSMTVTGRQINVSVAESRNGGPGPMHGEVSATMLAGSGATT